MGPPTLAAELTDRIIDFLHDDKQALNACALTHPTWLATSRFHLFTTITIDGRGGAKNWIPTSSSLTGARVLSYIRTVQIASTPDERMSRLESAVSLYQRIQRRLSESDDPTPHLPTVHLCLGRFWKLGEGGTPSALSQISDKVTHLELSNPIILHSDDFWPFVFSFPNLRSLEVQGLEMRGIAFYDNEEDRPSPQARLKDIPLSKVRMNTVGMGFIIDSLLAYAGVLTSLEEFGVLYEEGAGQTVLVAMAEAIQGNVKVLRLSAKRRPGSGYESPNHQLQSAFGTSV
jgi:hypothetical protein